jgi:hypothetical protein
MAILDIQNIQTNESQLATTVYNPFTPPPPRFSQWHLKSKWRKRMLFSDKLINRFNVIFPLKYTNFFLYFRAAESVKQQMHHYTVPMR